MAEPEGSILGRRAIGMSLRVARDLNFAALRVAEREAIAAARRLDDAGRRDRRAAGLRNAPEKAVDRAAILRAESDGHEIGRVAAMQGKDVVVGAGCAEIAARRASLDDR